MRIETIHLKEYYPIIDEAGADPILELMIQEEFVKDASRPVVLILPGGGYVKTARMEGQNVGIEFLTIGCNAFVLHYSVKTFHFPQQVVEVACAVDYIVKHADELRCDSSKIALMGFSAGGHLAASYCTIRNHPEVIKNFPAPHSVQACILCYPLICYSEDVKYAFEYLVGKEKLTDEDKELFSLDKQIEKGVTPQTFIWGTVADYILSPIHILRYSQALAEKNIEFELHMFPYGFHGLSTAKYAVVHEYKDTGIRHMAIWVELAKRWLQKVFDF